MRDWQELLVPFFVALAATLCVLTYGIWRQLGRPSHICVEICNHEGTICLPLGQCDLGR